MLIDSNIIVYAINESSPKHKSAQKFLLGNINSLSIVQQNILESLRVLTHPKFPDPMDITDAMEAVDGIAKAMNIIYPQLETYYLAIELIRKYQLKSDQIFDAYLVATMLTNEIREVVTDNEKDFKKFTEVKVINPFK